MKRKIHSEDGKLVGRVDEFLRASLAEYIGWSDVVCFSELGVPQRRKRSLAIFIRRDIFSKTLLRFDPPNNWPGRLLQSPPDILSALKYLPPLDSGSESTAADPSDPLHQVPAYGEQHYEWIASIPAGSGQSAWENACKACGDNRTPIFTVICMNCGANMYNRPHVRLDSRSIRAIKGFKTSYKRMMPNDLAPTMTTASSHFSSDIKLHPTQNRVLSARECALLQTIPNSFKWPKAQQFKKGYLIREMIGEAVPPLVTYRLGLAVAQALTSLMELK